MKAEFIDQSNRRAESVDDISQLVVRDGFGNVIVVCAAYAGHIFVAKRGDDDFDQALRNLRIEDTAIFQHVKIGS